MSDTLIRIIVPALAIIAIGGAVAIVCNMLLWVIYRDYSPPRDDTRNDDETAEERE